MEKIVKILLAILFFICLVDLPYGYFQFVRFTALFGFLFLAYRANERKDQTATIIYCGLAILFQPFFKIALGRQVWNVVDVVLGICLIISIWVRFKPLEKNA